MRKFQQGGVQVYTVPGGTVTPNIPNSQMINAPLIPVVDMAPYLNAQMDQQRRKDIYDQQLLKQQQAQLANDQKNYFAIHDKVFGELHNPAQKAIIDQVKADYKISDDAVAVSDNGVLVKSQLQALQRAARDQRTLGVLGEVEAANKLLQRPMPQLVDTELAQYQQKIDEYFTNADTSRRFNVKELDANYWNRPAERAINPANFYQTTVDTLKNFAEGINTPEELALYKQNWANNLGLRNPDQALKQGYIQEDPTTGAYQITPKGSAIVDAQLPGFLSNIQAKDQRKFELAEQTAEMRRRINPRGRGTSTATRLAEDNQDVLNSWEVIMSLPGYEQAFGTMDPFDPKYTALYDYILSRTDAQGVFTGTNNLEEVKRELRRINREVNTAPAAPAANPTVFPGASQTTTPVPTGGLRLGPNGYTQ